MRQGVSTSISTTTMSVTTLSDAGSTTSDSQQSDIIVSTPRRHSSTRRRTSAGAGDLSADERPRFTVSVDDDSPVPRRVSLRSRRARPPSPPPDHGTPGSQHVVHGDVRTSDSTESDAIARRRMTAAERRRVKNELLSSNSLEVSYVISTSINQSIN